MNSAPAAQQGESVERPIVSRWAIAALGTSLAFFCPLLTIIGPLLAVRALVEINANPLRTGRGLAWTAIVVGLLGAVAWVAFLLWWNANVRPMFLSGPQSAIVAAQDGDLAEFRAQFTGPGESASDESIQEFASTLFKRYGRFEAARQDSQATAPDRTGDRSVVVPYELRFDQAAVKADVRIRIFASGLLPRLESITVKDPQHAPLTFP